MRIFQGALLAAAVAAAMVIALPPSAASPGSAEPAELDCGEGRTWHLPLEACVTLPVLTKMVQPDYQGAAGLDYAAILFLRVSEKGAVGDVQIVKAPLEGEPTEDGEAALASLVQAVRLWRFAPGLDPGGRPVALSVVFKVHLRTEEGED